MRQLQKQNITKNQDQARKRNKQVLSWDHITKAQWLTTFNLNHPRNHSATSNMQ
jgi:hypothetical protein